MFYLFIAVLTFAFLAVAIVLKDITNDTYSLPETFSELIGEPRFLFPFIIAGLLWKIVLPLLAVYYMVSSWVEIKENLE